MTTDAEDALADLFEGRGEAGVAGFRPHTVELILRFSGSSVREIAGNQRIPLVEGSGQPPRVRWLKDEEVTVGNLSQGTIEVGPITPKFSGGGTDLTELQGASLRAGDSRYLFVRGPKHPTGALYRITSLRAERALRYMIQAEPSETANEPA